MLQYKKRDKNFLDQNEENEKKLTKELRNVRISAIISDYLNDPHYFLCRFGGGGREGTEIGVEKNGKINGRKRMID